MAVLRILKDNEAFAFSLQGNFNNYFANCPLAATLKLLPFQQKYNDPTFGALDTTVSSLKAYHILENGKIPAINESNQLVCDFSVTLDETQVINETVNGYLSFSYDGTNSFFEITENGAYFLEIIDTNGDVYRSEIFYLEDASLPMGGEIISEAYEYIDLGGVSLKYVYDSKRVYELDESLTIPDNATFLLDVSGWARAKFVYWTTIVTKLIQSLVDKTLEFLTLQVYNLSVGDGDDAGTMDVIADVDFHNYTNIDIYDNSYLRINDIQADTCAKVGSPLGLEYDFEQVNEAIAAGAKKIRVYTNTSEDSSWSGEGIEIIQQNQTIICDLNNNEINLNNSSVTGISFVYCAAANGLNLELKKCDFSIENNDFTASDTAHFTECTFQIYTSQYINYGIFDNCKFLLQDDNIETYFIAPIKLERCEFNTQGYNGSSVYLTSQNGIFQDVTFTGNINLILTDKNYKFTNFIGLDTNVYVQSDYNTFINSKFNNVEISGAYNSFTSNCECVDLYISGSSNTFENNVLSGDYYCDGDFTNFSKNNLLNGKYIWVASNLGVSYNKINDNIWIDTVAGGFQFGAEAIENTEIKGNLAPEPIIIPTGNTGINTFRNYLNNSYEKVITLTAAGGGSTWDLQYNWDRVFIDATSGNATLNLSNVVNEPNRTVEIVRIDDTTNTVTIDGYGAQTINGELNITLSGKYKSIKIYCDDFEWFKESETFYTIIGKLSDATAITRLTTLANWDINGAYVGTAITGTFEGQYYRDDNYFFFAYSDNDWTRTARV